MSKRADILKSYLRKHTDTPSRTIARYLFNRYPGLWSSESAVLNNVRYYRGKTGTKDRSKRRNMPDKNDYPHIPPAAKRKQAPVKLNTPGRWAIMGDLHVPYHDQKAVETAVNFFIDQKCDHLILNGDVLDAYQQSMWVKDPTQRQIDSEIETASKLIKSIETHFTGQKVYKIGNHEDRIESYLFQNAPKMIGMSKWDLREVLRKELGLDESWTFIGSKQLYTLGKLNGYHGHELPRGLTNPVSVGRGVWLRTKQSGFTNHWHSTSTHVETSGNKRKTWVCFSIGALCDLHPAYSPVNNWNHGCCYVDIDKNGNFSENNHRIVNGAIW